MLVAEENQSESHPLPLDEKGEFNVEPVHNIGKVQRPIASKSLIEFKEEKCFSDNGGLTDNGLAQASTSSHSPCCM